MSLNKLYIQGLSVRTVHSRTSSTRFSLDVYYSHNTSAIFLQIPLLYGVLVHDDCAFSVATFVKVDDVVFFLFKVLLFEALPVAVSVRDVAFFP